MSEELLETEAIELPPTDAADDAPEAHPLPARVDGRSDLALLSGEVKTAALAAAGGLVAGAATVAVVRATRNATPKRRSRRALRKERAQNVIASRSFLVDVHLLGQK
jgi:hypothetical protein